MFLCPICKALPWFGKSRLDLTEHIKLTQKKSAKSGTCPYANCFNNFGNIYTYMNHVEKSHIMKEPEEQLQNNIRKSISNDCPLQKRNCPNDSSLEIYSEANPTPEENILFDEVNIISKIRSSSDFKSKSAFDSDLLEFHKQQIARANEIVKDLYADVSLSKSVIQKIISIFSKYQETSIRELTKLDSESFANNQKIDTALKYLQYAVCNVNTESKVCKYLDSKEALIKPIARTVDVQLKVSLTKKTGRKSWSHVKTQIQTVPMKSVLKKYLELPNVYKIIVEELKKSDIAYPKTSFVQGEYWRRIIAESRESQKILIPLSFYFDDFETNNPLGSHKKKIGGIYYTISCLPPQYSGKLDNWFLAQFHNESDYKRLGNKRMLYIVKNQLLDLQNNGIKIKVDGTEHQVFFRIGRIMGDNLGLNQILGFASSFNATHYCRICIANKEQARVLLEEEPKFLRNPSNYDEDVEKAASTGNHSRGVKERCIFEPLVDVTQLRTVDPLHDLNEGSERKEMGIILNELTSDENINFDIEDLNTNIKLLNIDLASGINVPAAISPTAITQKHLLLSGSEMAFMIEYLRILIGKYIPRGNEIWQLYILLRKKYFTIMAPSFEAHTPALLKDLIKEHHELYDKLKLGNRIPKHHFQTHYPISMTENGPLRYTSSIRGEAVHRGRKITANTSISRKNICYTLAYRYQLTLAKKFLDQNPLMPSKSFKLKKILQVKALENFNEFKDISLITEDQEIKLLTEANYDGTLYKPGVTVVIGNENNLPVFAEIKHNILANETVYFMVRKQDTAYLDNHVQAYIITETETWFFIEYKNLATY